MKFFDWAYKEGGATAEKLHYIPLCRPMSPTRCGRPGRAEIKGADGAAVYN